MKPYLYRVSNLKSELATPFSNSFGQKVAVEAVTVIDWSVSLVGQSP